MPLEPGTLRVRLEFAKDIKDCDIFGRQDPYVRVQAVAGWGNELLLRTHIPGPAANSFPKDVDRKFQKCPSSSRALRVGDQQRQSKVCKNGGTRPVWNETFEFIISHENTIDMELMDADKMSYDDVIGRCAVSISKVREHGRDNVHAPVVSGKKNNKQRGFISLQLEFKPHSSNTRPGPHPTSASYPLTLPTPMYCFPATGAAPPHTAMTPSQQQPVWPHTGPGCTYSYTHPVHQHPVHQHPLQPYGHGYGCSYGPMPPATTTPSAPEAGGFASGIHPTWPVVRT